MKYDLRVQVYIRPAEYNTSSGLELAETQQIDLTSLSDAAEILVKLHEFFEVLKSRKAKS
jgi:hypothetical protein